MNRALMFPAPSRPGLLPDLSFKLSDPEAMVQNVGIGDLNGDGKYDFVVKTPRAVNIDPYPRFWYPSPTTFKLEAFLSDGTRLWTYDMGPGIERGVWYSPAIIYDFDELIARKKIVGFKIVTGGPRRFGDDLAGHAVEHSEVFGTRSDASVRVARIAFRRFDHDFRLAVSVEIVDLRRFRQ